MARKRNTGSRSVLGRRARVWGSVKGGAKKIAEIDPQTWWRTGLLLAGALSGLWTNSIQHQSNAIQKELDAVKAASIEKDKEYTAQMVTVNNKVDSCERRVRAQDEKIKQIEEEAKKLPPSPTKRRILTLTKQEPQKTGAVIQPLRAEETQPKYAESLLPSSGADYPWTKKQ